ncbi:bifunctional 4-hydroxy-2-oxoglutarate aldolase/2-dehydro-3-deoxy-phosphogluconate aldolase [Sphingosinicella sp. LHD-64]|uniref:bifunctional 4-hydroxy-2-oxoglutarate aldolase/2-dehydro-3-deoxy-phosphogluconate aldolase n=1 Tax=Sphingosinicella sp. LHD-64 TaxID=3072139 RepID=UPI00280FA911|nr:bifunctional 4-hydroxy-2-oxoglutarate aldolase/2-dehydro-3-deoxy-phosphogluconate aldolase [Sphingosinicella sp. LHD-64]MDQ8756970.1 bifunctional 4-hydroxy-2-oxoglutarate aldolase/2-dehydro-3-deoxy-phosphogluconate aldolase [Sphingosinicella sp. LHD-64]
MADIDTFMGRAPVIPVLVIDRVEDARPIAEALVAGGLPVLEVTLRTPAALDAIREMKKVDGAVVGAGTVLDPDQLDTALEAGAEFVVSPGLTDRLGRAAADAGVPFLPGTATTGDIMRALDLGFFRLKFFPATAAGGLPVLKAMTAVFGQVRFCPTGGITLASAPEWLAEPAVACVGGSWLVPRGQAIDPEAIRARAAAAAQLRSR